MQDPQRPFPSLGKPVGAAPAIIAWRSHEAVQTSLIVDHAGLVRLLPEWWGLWQRAVAATPFQAPAWLLPWWETYHPGDLFTVAVRVHGVLVGLLPTYREVGPLGRRLLPLGISVSDYLDVLVEPAHRRIVHSAIMDVLAAHADAWDTLSLEDLGRHAEGLALPVPAGFTSEVSGQSACPVLALRNLPETPRRVRKAWARAARLGSARIVEAGTAQVEPMLEALIGLHSLRWRERGEPGVLNDAAIRTFHRQAAPRLDGAGILRLYGFEVGGRLVGIYYGFVHRGRAYGYLSGFDPQYALQSPGTILLDHAIRQAAGEGCSEFDFLRGQEAYKYDWGAVDCWTARRTIGHQADQPPAGRTHD